MSVWYIECERMSIDLYESLGNNILNAFDISVAFMIE